jgi:CheY-like chemotaxis protein
MSVLIAEDNAGTRRMLEHLLERWGYPVVATSDGSEALERAAAQVKQLEGLLPICSYCKRIRDDHAYWHDIDTYVQCHTNTNFMHGICPCCYEEIVQPKLKMLRDWRAVAAADCGDAPVASSD